MKYFLHDSSSFDDEKIGLLFTNFGYEGLGLFYTILEKLAKQEHPINTNVLKHQLRVGKKLGKCWSFLESIELISSNNGETFNKNIAKFSGTFSIKKEKNKKRISQWRENQMNEKYVTRSEQICTPPKVNIKEKESKVNLKGCEDFASPPQKIPESEKPKKDSKKKNPKVIPISKVHSECREFFKTQAEKNGKVCYWQGREGKSLNDLLAKIKFAFKTHSGNDPTDEELIESFQIFINHLPEWQKQNGYDINSINTGFNRIANEIKSSNTSPTGKAANIDITEMFRRSRQV